MNCESSKDCSSWKQELLCQQHDNNTGLQLSVLIGHDGHDNPAPIPGHLSYRPGKSQCLSGISFSGPETIFWLMKIRYRLQTGPRSALPKIRENRYQPSSAYISRSLLAYVPVNTPFLLSRQHRHLRYHPEGYCDFNHDCELLRYNNSICNSKCLNY